MRQCSAGNCGFVAATVLVAALLSGATTAQNTTAATVTTSAAGWQYRLLGGTSMYGRLEVRPSSTSAWGSVCDDSFGLSDAQVACRSLGHATTSVSYRSVQLSERAPLTRDTWIW